MAITETWLREGRAVSSMFPDSDVSDKTERDVRKVHY